MGDKKQSTATLATQNKDKSLVRAASNLDVKSKEESDNENLTIKELQQKKMDLQHEVNGLSSQLMMLNREIKMKNDQLRKSKPGAPAPKPPGMLPPNAVSGTPQEKGAVFLEMQEELDQLRDKIIVQDHELRQLRDLKDNLSKLTSLEE